MADNLKRSLFVVPIWSIFLLFYFIVWILYICIWTWYGYEWQS